MFRLGPNGIHDAHHITDLISSTRSITRQKLSENSNLQIEQGMHPRANGLVAKEPALWWPLGFAPSDRDRESQDDEDRSALRKMGFDSVRYRFDSRSHSFRAPLRFCHEQPTQGKLQRTTTDIAFDRITSDRVKVSFG